jgi:hypothetical protein
MSGAASTADEAILVTPDQVPWTDSPVIPGAKGAFLVGNPSKAEVTVLRVKLPPHYKHPPHNHPFAEMATVLSGRLGYGLGDAFDLSKGQYWRRALSPSFQPSDPTTFGLKMRKRSCKSNSLGRSVSTMSMQLTTRVSGEDIVEMKNYAAAVLRRKSRGF